MEKSGKLSCCARGGAWFNNCGDAGDAKFGFAGQALLNAAAFGEVRILKLLLDFARCDEDHETTEEHLPDQLDRPARRSVEHAGGVGSLFR